MTYCRQIKNKNYKGYLNLEVGTIASREKKLKKKKIKIINAHVFINARGSFQTNNLIMVALQNTRWYTGRVKPYQCQHCQKYFARNSHLTLHIQSHTNEKPHQREYCQKCFAQKCTLTQQSRHKKNHIGVNIVRNVFHKRVIYSRTH